MDKKVVGISVASVIVLIVLFFLLISPGKEPVSEEIYFSESPDDWIFDIEDEQILNTTDYVVQIDVPQATKGLGLSTLTHQTYYDADGSIKSIFYGGAYEGEVFEGIYYDEQGAEKMRMTQHMNPNDGVIEGFGLFRQEEGQFVFYLFVDEDWKYKSNGNINVIWGNDVSTDEDINFMRYDFSNSVDGVYIMRIDNDVSWFYEQNPVTGRLFFGEISLDDFKNDNFNRTFLALT